MQKAGRAMIQTATSASDVSEMLLARTGDAMLSNDFEAFEPCLLLPYEIETLEGQRKIETRASLRLTFDAVHAHLIRQRVTMMAINCVSASFRTPNEVIATHETRLISGDIMVQKPYPALSVLVRQSEDAPWRITQTSYVIVDSSDLNKALHSVLHSGYSLKDPDALDEELRLLYVAVTRAEENLFIDISDVSSTNAPTAGRMGAAARALSRASRASTSARTWSNVLLSPLACSSFQRRSARTRGLAVTNNCASASG